MALSFQEAYRQAKAAAAGKPVKVAKPKAEKQPKVKPGKLVVDRSAEKQAKQVMAARRESRSTPRRDKPFPTLPVDLSTKIAVHIEERKMTVYVAPGTDIEAVKAKYAKKPLYKPKDNDINPPYQF